MQSERESCRKEWSIICDKDGRARVASDEERVLRLGWTVLLIIIAKRYECSSSRGYKFDRSAKLFELVTRNLTRNRYKAQYHTLILVNEAVDVSAAVRPRLTVILYQRPVGH